MTNEAPKTLKVGFDSYNHMTVMDLFSGCGGLSEGFNRAGFDVVAANEFWKPAADTYMRNHPKTRMFQGDITSRKTKKEILNYFRNKKCDVLIGGPPCQAYSVAGLRKPDDPRGKLFKDYLYMVKNLHPKIFVMENVKGLLSILIEKRKLSKRQRGEIRKLNDMKNEKIRLLLKRRASRASKKAMFSSSEEKRLERITRMISKKQREVLPFQEKLVDRILKEFKRLRYNVECRVLNSADYGVPQTRERVIFIGTRLDIPIQFPRKTHTKNPEVEPGLKPWVTVRQAIDDLKDMEENAKINHLMSMHGKSFLKKIIKTRIDENISNAANAFHRNNPDKPSHTVKDNHGSVFIHYEKNRVMTPRELARLQSFDDSYIFRSVKKDIFVQIGNSVPPRLAWAIAESIKDMLRQAKIMHPATP